MLTMVRGPFILAATLAISAWGAASLLQAHGDIHERIAALNQQIAASGEDPVLYLKRGELHRVHRDWEAALADYLRAAGLAPELTEVHYCLGRMWLEAGHPELAQPALDRFLAVRPSHADALLTRSRVLARLGKPLAAVEDLTQAIEQLDAPAPEYYLERARLLVAKGSQYVEEGLGGVEEGIVRLGPLVTLLAFAVEVEVKRGRYDGALGWFDALPEGIKCRPLWIARRGDILLLADRPTEAKRSYATALSAIEELPMHRRAARSTAHLQAHLRHLLAQLTGE